MATFTTNATITQIWSDLYIKAAKTVAQQENIGEFNTDWAACEVNGSSNLWNMLMDEMGLLIRKIEITDLPSHVAISWRLSSAGDCLWCNISNADDESDGFEANDGSIKSLIDCL